MLVDSNQEITNNMGSDTSSPVTIPRREHVAIHYTNVYNPLRFSVKFIAASPNRVFLVALRACISQTFANQPFSQLDIYDISFKTHLRFCCSIIEHEDITGLAWLDDKHIVSVSKQATINVYSVKLGIRTKVFTTDYGPITSMKYSASDYLLVTGTEYGYAVGYKISDSGNKIVCDKKMVKINAPIHSIDLHIQANDVPMDVCVPKKNLIKKKSPREASRKRKRSASSEESEDDHESDGDDMKDGFLANSDIKIYGASESKVVVWDYHKKAILDTVVRDQEVSCVLALNNGNFAIGDCEGYLSVYDIGTFTCRQNEKILKSPLSCLARDAKNSILLAASREPVITLLKADAACESRDEYILFERLRDHSSQVNCALFTSKKEFFTCSNDDLIIKFRNSKSDGKRQLKRYMSQANHQSRIHCGLNELLLIAGKALHIYSIEANTHPRSDVQAYPMRQSLPEPRRTCVVQANTYVHAAAFDDKWICYSNDRGIMIIDRPGLSKLYKPSQNLPNCHILRLCQSGRYLIAGQQKKIIIIDLAARVEENKSEPETNQLDNGVDRLEDKEDQITTRNGDSRTYKTVLISKLKGMVRDILHQQSTDRLIISCGSTRHFIYIAQLPKMAGHDNDAASQTISFVHKLSLSSSPLSHLALNYHDHDDTNLYIFTAKNQLIKCDTLSESFHTDLANMVDEQKCVSNMPKDKCIQGIALLSRNHCFVYDSNQIFKLDIDNNEFLNETARYDRINVVSNTIFERPEEILIV